MKSYLTMVSAMMLIVAALASQAMAENVTLTSFQLDESVMAEETDMPAVEDPNSANFEVPAQPEPVQAMVKKVKDKKAEVVKEEPPREIPLIETQNEKHVAPDVSYVTGGIGDDEKAAIEAAKADYNLQVVNTNASGSYLGDVRVTIHHIEGKASTEALSVVSGPLLYVKLPAGSYVLDAKLGEKTKQYKLTVAERKASKLQVVWK